MTSARADETRAAAAKTTVLSIRGIVLVVWMDVVWICACVSCCVETTCSCDTSREREVEGGGFLFLGWEFV